MKSLVIYIILAGFALAVVAGIGGCSSQNENTTMSPFSEAEKKADVPHLVSEDLSFAKDFVRLLSDAGLHVQEVRHSKFNGFFTDTRQAAFIKTDRGVVEAVFFDTTADVERIRVDVEETGETQYHRYTILKPPGTDRRIEGNACYFTKYRNVFIITGDSNLNETLKRLPL